MTFDNGHNLFAHLFRIMNLIQELLGYPGSFNFMDPVQLLISIPRPIGFGMKMFRNCYPTNIMENNGWIDDSFITMFLVTKTNSIGIADLCMDIVIPGLKIRFGQCVYFGIWFFHTIKNS
jgi:hypothetical protein